jgi:drug/metabolite transporter (DMT)-like permease
VFVRLAQAPALAAAFHRVFLASLLLAPLALPGSAQAWRRLSPRSRLALAASGVALALHFATWIASLSHTTVASSVLLVNTAPLFTLAFSRLFLGESVSRAVGGAIGLALGGAVLIAIADEPGGRHALTGDMLALAGAATLSLHHVIGRGLRAALPLRTYVLGVWTTAAAALLVLAAASRVSVVSLPPRSFGWLLALAVLPTLLGHGLVNRSLRLLPAPTVGLFLLGEPVGATLLAYALFDETPGRWTLAGGAAVLAALAIAARARPEGSGREALGE